MIRLPIVVSVLLALSAVGVPGAPITHAADPSVRPTREVYGFFLARDREYMLNEADYSVLSTVAFADIHVLDDGSLLTHDENGLALPEWEAWNAPWMGEVIAKAHAAGAKVALTITRFAWKAADKPTTVSLLADPAARGRLVAQTVDAVMDRGADGVNIDFEPMPVEGSAGFVSLIRDLRTALDARRTGLELTFDATARPKGYALPELLAPGAADAVFVMAYPFYNENSTYAGSTAPLGGRSYDVRATVDRYLSELPPDKVILGLPYYGSEWSTVTKFAYSRTRPKTGVYGSPSGNTLAAAWALADRHGWRWSSKQNISWSRWRYRACAACPVTWRQLYIESPRSLGLKYDFVNERDLRGVGFWKLGNDTGHSELYELLRTKFAP